MAAASVEIGTCDSLRAGAGLRLPHLAEAAAHAPSVGWLEVHPENFLANPHARELLRAVRAQREIGVHTVGLSVGSAGGVDRGHLERLCRFVNEIDPLLVSGHLAWSTHAGVYLNDLLPLPYDDEALRVVAAHVDEVQDAMRRPYVVENPASYVGFGSSTIDEAQFLEELARRTGCGLLCDVSNSYLSAANLGYDAYAYIDALPARAVAELHLGGFTRERVGTAPGGEGLPAREVPGDEASGDKASGDEVLIDTHAGPIDAAVWDLYAHALRRFGPRPTLVEWDNDLPPLAELAAEAARADAVAARAFGREAARDGAR